MAKYKHGETRTPEGAAYRNMIARCRPDAKPRVRKYYWDSGIGVCERWKGDNGVVRFVSDMGRRPSPEHTLERRNNKLGYSPDNCYWALPEKQSRNRRSNTLFTFQNKTLCLVDWAKETDIDPVTLWARVNTYKWPIERALTAPVRRLSPRGFHVTSQRKTKFQEAV